MRRNERLFSKRNSRTTREDGSTLLEVIVALVILSLLGVGAWNAAAASLRLMSRFHDKAISGARLLELDDRLGDLAGRVRTPFWMSAHVVTTEGGGFGVSYLDGDPTRSLTLGFQDGVLSVGDAVTTYRYTDFTSASFSPAEDDSKNVFGVTVTLAAKDGQDVAITARFGSTPMGSGLVK